MSNNLKMFGAITLIATVIFGLMAIQVNVWNECRQENSFFYCLRLVSK